MDGIKIERKPNHVLIQGRREEGQARDSAKAGGGGGPVGQQEKLSVRPSYLSFHPSRATMYKSDLPSFPIVDHCSVIFVVM
jgi:hypothetical protein